MLQIDEVFNITRQLAKTVKYQNLYSYAKELDIKIFENNRDFSPLQTYFLGCLNMYNNLHTDIYLGDIDEKVLEKELYEDAYLLYRKKVRNKEESLDNKYTNNHNQNKIRETKNIQWIFKKPKKVNK